MKQIFLQTEDKIQIAINHYTNQQNSVVIICPGWFMTKDSKPFQKISNELAVNYDIITMDFRGHGKSSGFYTFTAKEEYDLKSVIKYAKSYSYQNVYLLGFSLGAALVLIYGAHNNDIAKIIAVSPPTEFTKIENKMYSPDAWIPTLFQKFEPSRWISIRPGNPFLKKIKPVEIITKIKQPTLFIAGEKDPTVAAWHTEKLYQDANCTKKYILFQKARHAEDLYIDYPEKFINICTDWFNN